MKILGIDEAGKGPVIGPLVLAAAMVDSSDKVLKELGVTDSKRIQPAKREELFTILKKELLDYRLKIITPRQVDAAVDSPSSNLNKLEMAYMAALIDELKPDVAYIDTPTVNTEAFKAELKERLDHKRVRLVCENKADSRHVIVGAASILAKVTRDKEIEKLKKKYKVDFGSGYGADPYTKTFLEANWDKYPFFRKSWAPWKNLNQKKSQRKLGDW